jgi:hypothetical protein
MKHKFAAQLYTLRNELKQDFPGVLREFDRNPRCFCIGIFA